MRANPTGRASCPIHAGTLAAMIVPVSRSVMTSWTAPHARIVAMQAATDAANTAAARRARSAQEADPQGEVLNERTGARDAHAKQAAHDDFEQRQRDHRGERQGGDPVLDRREHADHFAVPVRCCLR